MFLSFADFIRQFSYSDDAHNTIETVGGDSGVSYGLDRRFVEIAVLSTESTILAKSGEMWGGGGGSGRHPHFGGPSAGLSEAVSDEVAG